MVDSGASVTVVGDESVKAVQASDANKGRQYKLADGSYIPCKGSEIFAAEQIGGLFTLKMWVPREQTLHFPGEANGRP